MSATGCTGFGQFTAWLRGVQFLHILSPVSVFMADLKQMPPPKSDATCPKCGSRAIRIRSRFWDRFWHSCAVSKFECDVCDHRFFLRPPLNSQTQRD
jgi:hypothetical protein